MKKVLDVIAVTVLLFSIIAIAYILGSIFIDIPSNVWLKVGKAIGYFTGGVIGLWAFVRGSKVLETWYENREKPEPGVCTHGHGGPHNHRID